MPTADNEEATQLFRSFDSLEADNSLDVRELQKALRLLERRSTEAKEDEVRLTGRVKELKRASAKAQAEASASIASEEEAAAAREAAELAQAEAHSAKVNTRGSTRGSRGSRAKSKGDAEAPELEA